MMFKNYPFTTDSEVKYMIEETTAMSGTVKVVVATNYRMAHTTL